MPSSTVENYVKQIYLRQQRTAEELVPMGRVATTMAVTPGTATSMVKALADSGLVVYEPRGGTRLTRGGEKLALHVLRRHRLVELFLVRIVGLDWSEVHVEAEALEHVISEKMMVRIDELLEHPEFDPHGDPIPTPKGNVVRKEVTSILESERNTAVRIARIGDQSTVFLQFLDRRGLTPGTVITVESLDLQADVVTVKLKDGSPVLLGHAAARKILVESMSG